MSGSNLNQANLAAFVFEDLANSSAAQVAKTGSTIIYAIDIDNTAFATDVFVKIYNNAAPTVGTTDPHMIIYVPLSKRISVLIPAGGITLGTAVAVATVLTAGTGGTGAPGTPPKVRIAYT